MAGRDGIASVALDSKVYRDDDNERRDEKKEALPTLQCVKRSGRMSRTDQESQENQDFFEPRTG